MAGELSSYNELVETFGHPDHNPTAYAACTCTHAAPLATSSTTIIEKTVSCILPDTIIGNMNED